MKKDGNFERRRPEVKREALDRMRTATNISKLAKELGIPRRTLYAWKDKELAQRELRKRKPKTREQELRQEVAQLREALGQASIDIDFFRGALQRIWDRQQPTSAAGESASTKKFEK
jgi:hypothetical protein